MLEIGCGTGRWTCAIARTARRVVAVDAAEPALALARVRLADSPRVTLHLADALTWDPELRRYDDVVMAFWLSHVPRSAWTPFLRRVASWRRPGAEW